MQNTHLFFQNTNPGLDWKVNLPFLKRTFYYFDSKCTFWYFVICLLKCVFWDFFYCWPKDTFAFWNVPFEMCLLKFFIFWAKDTFAFWCFEICLSKKNQQNPHLSFENTHYKFFKRHISREKAKCWETHIFLFKRQMWVWKGKFGFQIPKIPLLMHSLLA